MKKMIYTTALTTLIMCSITIVQAASKSREQSPSTQARSILEQIDSLSVSMVDTADELSLWAKSPSKADAQQSALDDLREDVNSIGHELRVLESEKGSLSGWEGKTLDEILPLMQEIATNTETEIETYSLNRNHMWTTAFPEESAKVYEDAVRVKEILDDNLKLASVREREQHIEAKLGSN